MFKIGEYITEEIGSPLVWEIISEPYMELKLGGWKPFLAQKIRLVSSNARVVETYLDYRDIRLEKMHIVSPEEVFRIRMGQ